MFEKKNESGIFNSLQPKQAFIIGLIAGILIACAIGFFVMIGLEVSDSDNGEVNNQENNQVANLNQQPDQPSAVLPGQPSASASNLKQITSNDHVRGSLNAPVMMVEFSDYQCPYCSKAHPTLQQLVDDYQGQVAWAYKHFPLDQIHPFARKAAEASECAAEQGKFWEYTDELYNNQSLINTDYLPKLAGQLGLDINQFNSCLSSGKYSSKVESHYQEGISVGISGTPGIYVNDQLVKGAYPYEYFKQIIDSLLAK